MVLLQQQQASDSSLCRTALLGFAILCDNVATMCEGTNQMEQVEGLAASGAKRNARVLAKGKTQPYTLSLRFSPKSVIPLERREEREHCLCNAQTGIPLSLPTPVPRQGVGDKTHKRLSFKRLYKRVADAHLAPFQYRYLRIVAFFFESRCQCSCTDTLTKLLTPCRYGNCFQRCWRYIYCFGFFIICRIAILTEF